MRRRDQRLNAASELARKRGIPERRCYICRGSGVAHHANPNAEDGLERLSPCPGCEGYGVAFEYSPAMVWTAGELLGSASTV
jgi:DnaJ-class molecular chaperone